MQKLSNYVIDRMISEQLTSVEIKFMIYVSQFQDEKGTVEGIYYKDICTQMQMSYESFYAAKKSLEKKKFIRVKKMHDRDHDITILNNDMSGDAWKEKGYLSTNKKIFYDSKFYEMPAGAQLLALDFLRVTTADKKNFEYRQNKADFIVKYTQMLRIKKRTLKKYLHAIKTFFTVAIINGKYYIKGYVDTFANYSLPSETENYRMHFVKTVLKRNNQKLDSNYTIKDMVSILRQYSKAAINCGKNVYEIFRQELTDMLYDEMRCVLPVKDRKVNPKYLNLKVQNSLTK